MKKGLGTGIGQDEQDEQDGGKETAKDAKCAKRGFLTADDADERGWRRANWKSGKRKSGKRKRGILTEGNEGEDF